MIAHNSHSELNRPQDRVDGLWSFALIALLFLAVSFLNTPLPGINEPHYLCKARALMQPDWCSRDFFLTSANVHYCFLSITGWCTSVLSFQWTAVVGRVVSAIMLALGWNILGSSLQLDATRKLLAALLFVVGSLSGSFSGEWLLGGFESKVPAWAFCLASLGVWISGMQSCCPGRMTAAGLLCGLACALHPVVGGWLAVCQCGVGALALLRHWQRPSDGAATRRLPWKAATGWILFGVTTLMVSLPGLIPALQFLMQSELTKTERARASFIQVFWRLRHHMDPVELMAQQWIYATVMLMISAGAFAILCKRNGNCSGAILPGAKAATRSTSHGLLVKILGFSALIAMTGIAVGWHTEPLERMTNWEWRASLLKFYPFRTFDALLPICSAFLLAAVLPVPQFAVYSRLSWLTRFAALAAVCWYAGNSRPVAPPGYTAAQYAEWQQACAWIQQHTPKDALILTPRESFAFKWFAERAEYVCYKDCPQDSRGILEWDRRLWYLHKWTLNSSADQVYREADLQILRRDTGCDYVLTRILGPFDQQPLWSGAEWKIYQVPTLKR